MTRPLDLVETVCARCGTICTAYLQPATDHEPGQWGVESEGFEPAVCPECGAELVGRGTPEPHALGAHPLR